MIFLKDCLESGTQQCCYTALELQECLWFYLHIYRSRVFKLPITTTGALTRVIIYFTTDWIPQIRTHKHYHFCQWFVKIAIGCGSKSSYTWVCKTYTSDRSIGSPTAYQQPVVLSIHINSVRRICCVRNINPVFRCWSIYFINSPRGKIGDIHNSGIINREVIEKSRTGNNNIENFRCIRKICLLHGFVTT